MSKINLDSPKITRCLTPRAKAKAARVAESRGLSVTQLIEELIAKAPDAAPPAPEPADIRKIIREELAALQRRSGKRR